MIHERSLLAIAVFLAFVGVTLALSFYFGRQAKSASSYFAAGGGIHWFVNGVAFAGDYLSAASFLGICGMVAFYGYDGFLYSIGYLAGWVVALFVIAEPLKRLGRFTFADALDAKFQSPHIKLAAGISTLAVSLFYLIPQMVGAGALMKPLIGLPHAVLVIMVGSVVILIVVTAGMVSTTYVQFLKGGLLVLLSTIMTMAILNRGLQQGPRPGWDAAGLRVVPAAELRAKTDQILPESGGWQGKPYVRLREANDRISVWRVAKASMGAGPGAAVEVEEWAFETQTDQDRDGQRFVNGLPQGTKKGENDFLPVGHVWRLDAGQASTGPLSPWGFLASLRSADILTWKADKDKIDGLTIYYPVPTTGKQLLRPGNLPAFQGIHGDAIIPKVNFVSLMLALFCGTASLPHILIRYYTVKDQASARKSTIVGIASIGFFYVLTLFLGLGAMTSGNLDLTDSNMSAPLLARSFGELLFAVISAIAFTTVLGTVSGLIVAASGAVVHDLLSGFLGWDMADTQKVRVGKAAAVVVGIVAIILGIWFEKMNVNYLVGWAFSVAASANLPSLVMLLFWKRTTKQGITAAIVVGMLSSLTWILASGDTYKDVYKLDPATAIVPFSQPGIVTIPLGFLVLVVVSLLTQPRATDKP